MRPKHLSDLRRCLAANVITTTFKFADRLAFELFQRFLVRHISPLMWLTSTLLIEARHRRIVNICQVAHIRRYDVAHLLLLVTLGQSFIKILRGGSGFYKNCSRPERPPPLVEPPFEGFNFAFESNRLDLLYFALNLETIYDVALSAEFGKLARALPFEFFNPDLKLAS